MPEIDNEKLKHIMNRHMQLPFQYIVYRLGKEQRGKVYYILTPQRHA